MVRWWLVAVFVNGVNEEGFFPALQNSGCALLMWQGCLQALCSQPNLGQRVCFCGLATVNGPVFSAPLGRRNNFLNGV